MITGRNVIQMQHDIIVIGAGIIGLVFAKAIADSGKNILLVEKKPEKVLADPPYDGREVVITHPSAKIMKELCIWDLIPADNISSIENAKVLNGESPYILDFDHDEAGLDNLGYIISNHHIRMAAYQSAKASTNIEFMTGTEIQSLGSDGNGAYVETSEGKRLKASIVIGADSRFSPTRKMLDIDAHVMDFERTSIVCTMKHEKPHHGTAYECFNFDRTVAVLPRNNNQVAVIITVKPDEADDILGMDKQALADDVAARIDDAFGSLSPHSELFSYPLVSTMAKTFHAHHFALIGDAAVGMHPVTAQGLNLGIRGADFLAGELKRAFKRDNPATLQKAIESYSRNHRLYSLPLYHATNALVLLYSNESHVAKFARRTLLRLGNRLGPVKKLMIDRLGKANSA